MAFRVKVPSAKAFGVLTKKVTESQPAESESYLSLTASVGIVCKTSEELDYTLS